jgi:hypothetical protein
MPDPQRQALSWVVTAELYTLLAMASHMIPVNFGLVLCGLIYSPF